MNLQAIQIRKTANAAFTLTELMTVVFILGMVAAIAAPSLINLMPSRKAKISEVFTYLEMARARAMATKQDVFVCFADASFPDPNFKFRTMAMFAASDVAQESCPLDVRELRQVENWLDLTQDVMLAVGADLRYRSSPTPTILDSAERREFSFTRGGVPYKAALPYLVFNRTGRLEVPFSATGLETFVGLVDGYVDESGTRQIKNPPSSGGIVGELIAINALNGKMSHLRD